MVSHRIGKVDDTVPLKNGIVTVSDKHGLVEFVSQLFDLAPGLSLFSTGGTYRTLSEKLGDVHTASAERESVVSETDSGLHEISSYTGQPETEGGLVKTLDYRIYLGVLTEAHNEAHIRDRERTESRLFDLVVVNLYPFSETVSQSGVDIESARGNIDIGGPTLLRAAAKNFPRVAVVCDPADYPGLLDELRRGGGALSLRRRFALAQKAFAHVAEYDRAITEYLASRNPEDVAQVYGVRSFTDTPDTGTGGRL